MDRLQGSDEHFDAALAARNELVMRRARKAAHELTLEGRRRSPDAMIPAAFEDSTQRTLVTHPDQVLFVRAARDALTRWLDEATRKAGGPSTDVPAGWPYDSWPT
jgi:hypothetical protein